MFDQEWFLKHQKRLLWFANTSYGRDALCLNGKRSSVDKRKIIKIEPNSISWIEDIKRGKVYISTEFRTYNKFSKRLHYAYKPIWRAFHWFDMNIANPLIPAFNLGFDTLTAFPDADPETNTVDGHVNDTGNDLTFSNLRLEPGSGFADSGTGNIVNIIGASATTDQYANLYRAILLYDTSSIPDTNNLDSATHSHHITSRVDTLSGAASANSAQVLVSSAPASDTALAAGDFDSVGSTEFGRSAKQADLTDGAYSDITLNASGLNNISKTGVSKFALRYGFDFDNTTTGITWSANQTQEILAKAAETTGTTQDPKLVVTHSVPVEGVPFDLTSKYW